MKICHRQTQTDINPQEMARRISKTFLLLICSWIVTIMYFVYSSQSPCIPFEKNYGINTEPQTSDYCAVKNITCHINRQVSKNVGVGSSKRLQCNTDGKEIFVPFSFIKSSYEAIGEFSFTNADKKEFDISQSYSKVYSANTKYEPGGSYMHFKYFDVESRSRVKCVSASEGVPISTQWDPKGYFYPTQIAQYALSHYSMHDLSSGKKTISYFEDGETYIADFEADNDNVGDFEGDGPHRVIDTDTDMKVVHFNKNVKMDIDSSLLIISLDLKNIDAASFAVHAVSDESGAKYKLIYSPTLDYLTFRTDRSVAFGFGEKRNEWIRFTRDIFNDIKKSQYFMKKPFKEKKSSLRIKFLEFEGIGRVTNISVSDEEHLRMFIHGADWFVRNQDTNGGWPSNVVFNKNRKKYPEAEEIPAGWYGAMCQGQAISVLCRAYLSSGDEKYIESAKLALNLFSIPSSRGGIKTEFMGVHPWYEEYPTTPSTFILNGFIYSLLGLYDLSQVAKDNVEAKMAFEKGMESLKALLPFYESGHGTFYDLRHYTMKTAPKRARWDYHATHVNQLLTLLTIDSDRQLRITAERWRGYMVGKKTPHN